MKLAALATLTWAADLSTGLLLPPGAERNPVAAILVATPLAAFAAKASALSLAMNAARYHRGVLGVVAIAGIVGAVSNAWALA